MFRVLLPLLLLLLAFLSSCTGVQNGGTFKTCSTAAGCLTIEQQGSANCPNPVGGKAGLAWFLKLNAAATRRAVVSLREDMREVGVSPFPPEQAAFSSIEIDRNTALSLGCVNQHKGPEHWIEHKFTILSSCWAGECPAKAAAPTDVRKASCTEECGQGGKFCLTPSLISRDPFTSSVSKFNADVLSKPASVPFQALTSTLVPPTSACSRGNASLSPSGLFESVGPSCALYFPTLPLAGDSLDGIGLQLPPGINGKISWLGSPAKSFSIAPTEGAGISFPKIYIDRPSGTKWDNVKVLIGDRDGLTIETENTYCISIKFPTRQNLSPP